jgi:hemerythrin superfamily protein
MAIPDDPVSPAPHASFPVDDPVQALLRDHNLVRKLADTYVNTTDQAVKQQATTQLLQAIHMHSRLEESVFYPGVRGIDPNLIAHFEDDHQQVDELLAELQGMNDTQRAEPQVRQLIESVLKHIHEEETEFFPKLQHAAIDLSAIGLQMQSFEANLVHMQAQLSDQAGRR